MTLTTILTTYSPHIHHLSTSPVVEYCGEYVVSMW